ncbi:MAG: oxygen-independent coproporphyrinogen III oxidase [Pseudomonadota bacterium]
MQQAELEIPSLDLIRRYGVTGPRFTSYPTALSFDEGIGDDAFREAVADSNDRLMPAPLTLYVHLPFCRTLCYYCGCHKKITRNAELVEDYVKALIREIATKSELVDRDRVVRGVHWGGGTPTYLSRDQRRIIMAALSDHFPLASDSARDFSVEIDPRTIEVDDLASLRGLGFNRVSFGVQDFDPDVQRAVNRVQPYRVVAEHMERARTLGFRSISIDLIYGLPLQTQASFATTIDQAIDLRPDALSVFNYAHLPARFPAQRLIREEDLPDAATRIGMFRDTVERLRDAGYEYIGMDHFALPMSDLARARREGNLHRCFQGYASGADSETLAFGVSGISNIGDGYFQVEKSLPSYIRRVRNGNPAIARGYVTTPEDRRVADVIQSIMCYGSCDTRAWSARFDSEFDDFFADDLVRLSGLVDDGLVVRKPGRIDVTPVGWVFLRTVASCFDRTRHGAQPVADARAYSTAV